MSSAGHEIGIWRLLNRAVSGGIVAWAVVYLWPGDISNSEFLGRLGVVFEIVAWWFAIGFVLILGHAIFRALFKKGETE